MSVEITEEERQAIILALALMALQRPGWDNMCRRIVREKFGGVNGEGMFVEFKRCNR